MQQQNGFQNTNWIKSWFKNHSMASLYLIIGNSSSCQKDLAWPLQSSRQPPFHRPALPTQDTSPTLLAHTGFPEKGRCSLSSVGTSVPRRPIPEASPSRGGLVSMSAPYSPSLTLALSTASVIWYMFTQWSKYSSIC